MRRLLSRPPLLALALAASGCTVETLEPIDETETYDVTIRRDSFGVPHILAGDLPSATFGLGYAGAEDYVCILADQVVMATSQRARFLGAGEDDVHVTSDFFYAGLDVRGRGAALLESLPDDLRAVVDGFVAGYNHYLEQTPSEALPAPCAGEPWVRPITARDWAAYMYVLNLRASALPFSEYILGAVAPVQSRADQKSAQSYHLPSFKDLDLGSNAWAVGKDLSQSGGGMLIGNPHFPWVGELKFYESHVTIPGELNVYGASLIGVPVINIGFTEGVAWSHTVTPSNHFTVYKLDLVPGNPLKYVVDGEEHDITATDVTVEVLEADGTLSSRTRQFWRSHHGPMVAGPLVVWDDTTAFTIRDANEGNDELLGVWAAMNRAQSVGELLTAMDEHHGIPWVFTTAADKNGDTLVVDASRVPRLSAATEEAYRTALENDVFTSGFAGLGVVLLDGSTASSEWEGSDGPDGGLVPVSAAPQLSRNDFVMNANEDLWMANPAEPLTDFSITYGVPGDPMTARTRTNLRILTDGQAAGDDGKLSFLEMREAALNDRASHAENLRAEVVTRCTGVTDVDVDGTMVDISEACSALANWNERLDLDAVGALVWRELLGIFDGEDLVDAGALYQTPFDPANPLTTPSGLVPAPMTGADPILVALGRAVLRLESAGLTAMTPLGDAQYTMKNDLRIPIHGGSGAEGATNVVGFSSSNSNAIVPRFDPGTSVYGRTGLYDSGYPINNGSSFIMAVELTSDGPRASALLTYSESSDPASPHYSDQTQAFSQKAWRDVLFDEEQVTADPSLKVTELSVPRPKP